MRTMKKVYKVIEQENGKVTVYGSNRSIRLYYTENSEDAKFKYRGRVYSLDEFIRTPKGSFLDEFDGYLNDTYFSGVAVKLIDGENIKAFTFVS